MATLFVARVFADPQFVAGALNSDTLLPASFWWDALHMPGGWATHDTARIASLLPDMAAFGVLQTVAGFAAAVVGAGWLQLVLLLYGAGLLLSRLTGGTVADGAAAMTLPLAGIGLLALHEHEWNALTPVLPIIHAGPFALSLFGIAAASTLLMGRNRAAFAAVAGAAALVFVSDAMLLLTYVGPVAAASVAGRAAHPPGIARVLLALVAGLALGWAGMAALHAAGLHTGGAPGIHPDRFVTHARAFVRELPAWAAQHPALAVASAILGAAALATLVPHLTRPITAQSRFVASVALLSGAATVLFTACFYEDLGAYRYLGPAATWVMLLAVAPLARHGWRAATAAVLACTLVVATSRGELRPVVSTYDTETAACLRNWRGPLGLHAALAGYWRARSTAVALDWTMQVDSIRPTGEPLLWANDPTWFTHDIADPARPPRYDAIIVDDLDTAALERRYGSPARVVTCPGATLWHYMDGADIQRRLTNDYRPR